jgi:hypothetical protein
LQGSASTAWSIPRIQERRNQTFEVASIPRSQDQVVPDSGRRNLRVGGRPRPSGTVGSAHQLAPDYGGALIER